METTLQKKNARDASGVDWQVGCTKTDKLDLYSPALEGVKIKFRISLTLGVRKTKLVTGVLELLKKLSLIT